MIVNLLIFSLFFTFGICDIDSKDTGLAYVEDVVAKDASTRIIAGNDAEPGQIPHQVHLRMINNMGRTSSCGGSIIHHEWIMTAAHCLGGRVSFVVRSGAVNMTRPHWILDSTNRYLHPLYNEFSGIVQTHDIALLRFEHYVPYGPLIKPVRIQSSEQKDKDYTGVVMTASGYGLTLDANVGGAVSQWLQWTYLLGISNDECKNYWYPSSTAVDKETICAEFYNDPSQSTCSGDSGGPLTVVDADGELTLVGVVSFVSSSGCDSPFPSGYVRPGWYHDWITEVTGIDFDWTLENIDKSTVIEEKAISVRPQVQLQGGSVPFIGEYPNLVHLRMTNENTGGLVTSCAGSLIHNRWVLTSANCIDDAWSISLRFAVINVPNPELVVESTLIHKHSEWDNITKINDIALVETANVVEFTEHIHSVNLAVGDYKVPSTGKLCSWGQNSDKKPGDLLYCLDMTLTEQADGTIVGYSTQGKATEFDIGAPLMSNGYQIGVLTKWPSDGEDYSAVFVQPRNFMNFITDQTEVVFPETPLVSSAFTAHINKVLGLAVALFLVLFQY